MNGDHYEEEICGTCGLGLATECRGHVKPTIKAPRLLEKEIDVFCDLRNKIEDMDAALHLVMSTPHFFDMPDHVQEAVKKAVEGSGQ